MKRRNGELVILLLYVDDGLVMSTCGKMTMELLKSLKNRFQITVQNEVRSFLGLEIRETDRGIMFNQEVFIDKLVEKYRIVEAKAAETPIPAGWKEVDSKEFTNNTLYREIVGQLLYVCMVSRPDIGFAVNILSRVLEKPSISHWNLAKRVVRYLKGSSKEFILFDRNKSVVSAFTDADFAGDEVSRESTTGVVVLLGSGPIVWRSKLQGMVALSTTEAELMSLVEGCRDVIWVRMCLRDILGEEVGEVTVNVDNQSTLKIVKHQTSHQRTKHIDIRLKYLRTVYAKNKIMFKYCPTELQVADLLTKGLDGLKTLKFRKDVGFVNSDGTSIQGKC